MGRWLPVEGTCDSEPLEVTCVAGPSAATRKEPPWVVSRPTQGANVYWKILEVTNCLHHPKGSFQESRIITACCQKITKLWLRHEKAIVRIDEQRQAQLNIEKHRFTESLYSNKPFMEEFQLAQQRVHIELEQFRAYISAVLGHPNLWLGLLFLIAEDGEMWHGSFCKHDFAMKSSCWMEKAKSVFNFSIVMTHDGQKAEPIQWSSKTDHQSVTRFHDSWRHGSQISDSQSMPTYHVNQRDYVLPLNTEIHLHIPRILRWRIRHGRWWWRAVCTGRAPLV